MKEKKEYTKPKAVLVEMDFEEHITASGGLIVDVCWPAK